MTWDGGPVAWLDRRAREAPDEPWLFFRGDLDWRWHSHAQVADRVARTARDLDHIAAAAPFDRRVGADSVAWMMAILARGGVARPTAGAPPPGPAEVSDRLSKFDAVSLPEVSASGGVGVAAAEAHRCLGVAALSEASSRLAARVAERAVARPSTRREIWLVGDPLDRLETLLVLSSALVSGAVVALDPDPESFVEAARWIRPTAVLPAEASSAAGSPAELIEALAGLGRWNRLRFLFATDLTPPGSDPVTSLDVVVIPAQETWQNATNDPSPAAR